MISRYFFQCNEYIYTHLQCNSVNHIHFHSYVNSILTQWTWNKTSVSHLNVSMTYVYVNFLTNGRISAFSLWTFNIYEAIFHHNLYNFRYLSPSPPFKAKEEQVRSMINFNNVVGQGSWCYRDFKSLVFRHHDYIFLKKASLSVICCLICWVQIVRTFFLYIVSLRVKTEDSQLINKGLLFI